MPAAIHVSPEALLGGDIGKVRNGDLVRLDANTGELSILVDAAEWAAREHVQIDLSANQHGVGRDLFAGFRQLATAAEDGAMSFAHPLWAGR